MRNKYYVAYLTEDELLLLYTGLDYYEGEVVGPADQKEAERLAIVRDALDEAYKRGMTYSTNKPPPATPIKRIGL